MECIFIELAYSGNCRTSPFILKNVVPEPCGFSVQKLIKGGGLCVQERSYTVYQSLIEMSALFTKVSPAGRFRGITASD